MVKPKDIEDTEKLRKQRAQLDARIQDKEQRTKSQLRKAETHVKVLMGAWLMNMLLSPDTGMTFEKTFPLFSKFISDRDKERFRNFVLTSIKLDKWPESVLPLIDQYFPEKPLKKYES